MSFKDSIRYLINNEKLERYASETVNIIKEKEKLKNTFLELIANKNCVGGNSMYSLVLLSGGIGSRMREQIPKQYLTISGKPIIVHILEKIELIKEIDEIIIGIDFMYKDFVEKCIKDFAITKSIKFVQAGSSRHQTSYFATKEAKNLNVIIHEAARPFVKISDFKTLIENPNINAIYGIEIPFTVSKSNGKICDTLNRSELINVQLPQKYEKSLLLRSFEKSLSVNKEYTEESSMVYEQMNNVDIKVLEGTKYNIKVTYPIDLKIGEVIYKEYILGSE